MDFSKQLADPKSWLTQQLFKSRLMDLPIYKEILTLDNRIQKIVIFSGTVMNFNDIGTVLSSRYGRLYVDAHPPLMNPRQQAMVDLLVEIGVIKPEYEEHPFHKLKNPIILSYVKGPKFEKFKNFLTEISMQETELILESDLIKNEQRSGSDQGGE